MSTAQKVPSPDDQQFDLFGDRPAARARSLKNALGSGRRFVTGDPRSIYIGTARLEDYLKQAGQTAPFTVAQLLDEQDWQPFEARYAAVGRAAYAPRLMLGLVLYGVMQGIHSLRELERLARLDLGCMWVTGGIAPDHANIGRFIVQHEESLTADFFESLTRSILAMRGARSSSRLAGDGTVIEAACSHYKLLKAEAVKARADAARAAAADNPDSPEAQRRLAASEQGLETLEARQKARQRSGSDADGVAISAREPEAMVQRLKRGSGIAPSYKPSVLANEDRIITAHAVHPSSETKVIANLLDQSARVTGEQAEELLLDAGYFNDEVIAASLARDVSLLCPDGVGKHGKVYPKASFHYDAATDTYRCPAGQTLILLKRYDATPFKRTHARYGTKACEKCPLRAECTTSANPRRIERYPEDNERDALRMVMQQPKAAQIFRQRKAMVEPVFSHLRGQQGLRRFRCTGLRAVKREFALHVMGYNLARAIALARAFLDLFSLAHGGFMPLRARLDRIFHMLRFPAARTYHSYTALTAGAYR